MKRSIIEAVFAQEGRPLTLTDSQSEFAASMAITLKPSVLKCPLKAGDEIITTFDRSVPVQTDEELDFTLDVAFNESRIAECEPMLETLQQMSDLVDNLVLSFKPFLT